MISPDLLFFGNSSWLGMANHLWQSTLFAAAAWFVTILLKNNHARIRYWVWFSVSIKFLVPFSLIVSLGGLIAPEWSEAPVAISSEWNAIQTINLPFSSPGLKALSQPLDIIGEPSPSGRMPFILSSLWLCGSLAILLSCYRQRKRLSGMVRKAELLKDGRTVRAFHRIKLENGISHTVRIVSTRDTMEPGVFGIFRPVILLPAGVLGHINDSEPETILLHEFAHIRSRDNLIAFIHMLVEALFWFHPIVWWTGSRLVAEREQACDESVLLSIKDPRVYAEGILKVCEHYFMSPPAWVAGVIGADLKKRVESILKKQIGRKLGFVRLFFLSLSGLSALCIPLAIGMINAPAGRAQASGDNRIASAADVYAPDHIVSSKTEKMDGSSKAVTAKGDKDISSALNSESSLQEGQNLQSDRASEPGTAAAEPSRDNFNISSEEVATLKEKMPDKPVMDSNSPAIVMAHAETQPAVNAGVPEVVHEAVLGADSGKSVLLVQKETPLEVSPDATESGSDIKTDAADADQNRQLSQVGKSSTIPGKYNLDNELQAVDRISTFGIESYENIDKQSLILEANHNDYYLLVLRRPRFEMPYGQAGISYTGSTIIAGHDRVVMDSLGTQYYVIDKIYKLKGRAQMTEIKERLRNG